MKDVPQRSGSTDAPQRSGSTVVVMAESPEPNMVLRVVWFVFVGWWLSFWAITVANLITFTIIGIPLRIWIINRLPQIVTLKSSRTLQVSETDGGVTMISYGDREQRKFWVRCLYFTLVGWWATSLWLYAAWFFCIFLITLPIAFWMFGQVGKIQTLRR